MEQSIYDKYHHNIICGKLNFDIPLPPCYYKKTWDYIMANTEGIQRSIFTEISEQRYWREN